MLGGWLDRGGNAVRSGSWNERARRAGPKARTCRSVAVREVFSFLTFMHRIPVQFHPMFHAQLRSV